MRPFTAPASSTVEPMSIGGKRWELLVRECVLLIGTQFSNLYTAVDTPARGRVV